MKRSELITLWPIALALLWCTTAVRGVEPVNAETYYRETVRPILVTYCFDCHANGAEEGGHAFDRAASDDELIRNRQLWWAVLKNLRAGIMPPADQERPSHAEQKIVTDWIKTTVFGVDPRDPDPGRVTVRRLNRAEYRNTIRDLMGIDFNAEVVFPPEDTGFGFDNVGDVLSLSPLLLEKYLQSAKTIVEQAVPTVCKVISVQELTGQDFRGDDDSSNGSRMSYGKAATVTKTVHVDQAGQYSLRLEVQLHGSFDFDPSRCRVRFSVDGDELYQDEYSWDERKSVRYQFPRDWQPGDHTLSFQLEPIQPQAEKPAEGNRRFRRDATFVNFHIQHVNVEGPADPNQWKHPKNYERFFTRDEPPTSEADRTQYAREVLAAFAKRAFRRPADEATLSRLVALAEATYQQPNKTFEAGIAQAMAAVLASPRFLFRLEATVPDSGDVFPLIDEYSLASRLSYFFWSTTPDDELLGLADRGELRKNLGTQIERMLKDGRSEAFVQNFVGQWLRARDVEHVSLDPIVALGFGEEYEQLRGVFRRRFRRNPNEASVDDEEWQRTLDRFRELRAVQDKFDGAARRAMRRETEMLFDYIVREDRSVLEILDCDYTFVNEKLADLYGLPGVKGEPMRRVTLPADSPRGGILTQGTMLTVTSNPTRTSPVKRGRFILDNILGTPSPPAPGGVPELEEAAKKFGDREPTLREVLAAHRESAICASCHARMDPLGIALENFNALGMWRDTEHGQPIDSSGELITGETFQDVRDLKKILVTEHRSDFYRCITQKLMTYALGRGLEYYDEYTVDEIVEQLERNDGRFSALLTGILTSPAFQRQRRLPAGNETANVTR